MSLIRALSNPEGLYVYGTSLESGDVYVISTGRGWPDALTNIASPLAEMVVPEDVFESAAVQWLKTGSGSEPVEVEGFRVEERHVFMDDGALVPDRSIEGWFDGSRDRENNYLVKLSYEDRFCFLWGVTWIYVISSFEERARKEIVAEYEEETGVPWNHEQCDKCGLWFPPIDSRSGSPCLAGVGDEQWCVFCDQPGETNDHATPGIRGKKTDD